MPRIESFQLLTAVDSRKTAGHSPRNPQLNPPQNRGLRNPLPAFLLDESHTAHQWDGASTRKSQTNTREVVIEA